MNLQKYLLFLLVFSFQAAFAQQLTTDKEKLEAIEKTLSERFPDGAPGASVLIVRDGKTFFKKGYGLANVALKTPNKPETVFRIGSITKQFTSSAILQLVEAGKIGLDDEITKYLPDYPTQNKKITIEHLLTHTSGIKSYTDVWSLMTKEAKAQPVAVNAMIDRFKNEPMDFNPGDEYRYNNSGYYLLGAIIEKVSGATWAAYMEKNFFKPLKMSSTFASDKGEIPNKAEGYNKEPYLVADYIHPSVPYAAGAIFSTIDDLWKWNEAIFKYKIVRKETLEKAWTPLTLNSKIQISYGYGWQIARLGDEKVIGHSGGIDGFLSYAMFIPESKLFITVLHNSTFVVPQEISFELADIMNEIAEDKAEVITLTENQMDGYAGIYKISENEDRVISREGMQLYSQRTGGSRYGLLPLGGDLFKFDGSSSHLKFHRSADGTVEKAELLDRSWVRQIATLSTKELPAEKQELTISDETFKKYIGQYELTPGFILTVFRDGRKFMTQATGQPAFEIFAETQTRFSPKAFSAILEFTVDEKGEATKVTLNQGGRSMPGRKISSEVPKPRMAIALNAALYDNYAGEYELQPGFVITVRRDDERLLAQATGQPAFEIFPESETRFFYKAVDAQIEFVRDDGGKISGLKLYQGGRTLPGKRIR